MTRRSVTRGFATLTAALLLAAGPLACEREQGPMEKAGEKVDDAVDKVLHPNEGPLEKAGRKADETVDSMKEKLDE